MASFTVKKIKTHRKTSSPTSKATIIQNQNQMKM